MVRAVTLLTNCQEVGQRCICQGCVHGYIVCGSTADNASFLPFPFSPLPPLPLAGLPGDFDSNVLRLYYSSLTTPSSTIDHDMSTGKRATKKVQPVLGGFSKEDYTTERLWVKAADGVEVPVTLAYRKGLVKLDGSDPMLLHG